MSTETIERRVINEDPIVVLYETKDREALINDVLARKRDVDYHAVYIVAPHAETTQKRPKEFECGFEQWLYDIKVSNMKAIEEEENRDKIFEDLMTERFKNVEIFLKKIMRVY